MSRFIEGRDRRQRLLLPDCVDDYVSEDSPVRVVDAFVDELDLAGLGFEGAAATGRPGYHPATLLKLYIYGYLNRHASAHRARRPRLLLRPGGACLRSCGRYADLPQAAHLRRQGRWALGQAGLRLPADKRHLSLPGWRDDDEALRQPRTRHDVPRLCHARLPLALHRRSERRIKSDGGTKRSSTIDGVTLTEFAAPHLKPDEPSAIYSAIIPLATEAQLRRIRSPGLEVRLWSISKAGCPAATEVMKGVRF